MIDEDDLGKVNLSIDEISSRLINNYLPNIPLMIY
jgi:hypothetical protein